MGPTVEDLQRVLAKTEPIGAFIQDALEILKENSDEDEPPDEATTGPMAVAASGCDGTGRSGEETMVDELEDLASTARRCAVLLLVPAHYADQQADKARTADASNGH